MDWIVVLESSRQALSINGGIKSKYQCFTQSFQLGRGLESATQCQNRHLKISEFQNIDCKATSSPYYHSDITIIIILINGIITVRPRYRSNSPIYTDIESFAVNGSLAYRRTSTLSDLGGGGRHR